MTKPEKFIASSDYTTFKNDANGTVSLTVPASLSIASGAVYSTSVDIAIGAPLAESRIRITSSKQGSQQYLGEFGAQRTGTVGGAAAPYTLFVVVSRVNSTTTRLTAMIANVYAGTLTSVGSAETFTLNMNTFLTPVV